MTKPSNPNRTGGPKSVEGRAVAARNAIRSGAYAVPTVLYGESEQEFLSLKEALLADFQASGVIESSLVHELSVLTWKKLRLERVEHRILLARLQAPVSAAELFEAGLERQPEFEIALNDPRFWEDDYDGEIDLVANYANRLTTEPNRPAVIREIKSNLPNIYGQLVRWVRDDASLMLLDGVDVLDLMQCKDRVAETGNYDALIAMVAPILAHRILEVTKSVEYAMSHRAKIEAFAEKVRDQRLANFMGNDGPVRARDDLNRSFFRVLKELRTQQEWRIKHRVIDVTPED